MAKKTSDANSVAGAKKAMENALAGTFQPPKETPLSEKDLPFWNAIVRARAREEWDENTLQVAAQLARTRRMIEESEKLLELEGAIISNDRGTPIKNPLFSVIEDLTRRQMALMRSLQVTATATAGQGIHNKPKRNAEKNARAANSQTDDSLLG
ncbi:P27 family phage terminase small subunit [Limnobacter sp.]|uniref:P27 family phage terminase small subunit n=1 Tax=Limnobacter sp. TaxID=2003368 RepID=UPI0025BE078A|nr:P27 family phage terminase small subunit [Limnobacter sp.]